MPSLFGYAHSSVILYASTKKAVPTTLLSALPLLADGSTELSQLTSWTIRFDSLTVKDSPLFNWKDKEAFRYSSAVGEYSSTFTLTSKKPAAHYFLDLGKVYFTAEITIDGKAAGKRIFAPYRLDITPFIQAGVNQLSIRVTPTELNGFIGKGVQGDVRYRQFKNKADQVMSAGLEGPVRLLEK